LLDRTRAEQSKLTAERAGLLEPPEEPPTHERTQRDEDRAEEARSNSCRAGAKGRAKSERSDPYQRKEDGPRGRVVDRSAKAQAAQRPRDSFEGDRCSDAAQHDARAFKGAQPVARGRRVADNRQCAGSAQGSGAHTNQDCSESRCNQRDAKCRGALRRKPAVEQQRSRRKTREQTTEPCTGP